MNTHNPTKPSELLALAEAAILADCFLFISGSGGAGKTSIVCNELSKALNRPVWYANINGQGPTEVTGYGRPQDNGDMDFYAPSIWPTYERVKDQPVILFLDELPEYDPQVGSLLRSLYPSSGARYIGPHRLGTNVLVIVAGNRRCDGTKARVEDAPFTERCIKVDLEPDLGDWLDWYDRTPVLAESGAHVPAFLRFGTTSGDGLDFFNPPVVMPYDGTPHPCPRTWTTVVRVDALRKTQPAAYRKAVIGSVGQRAALAYFAFLQTVDRLPDIASLKANPNGFAAPADAASQFALVSACLACAKRGIPDVAAGVHAGAFDWLVTLLLMCRGDVREFGALSAVRRGIPLDEHSKARELILS
jgi:hypothetical protein